MIDWSKLETAEAKTAASVLRTTIDERQWRNSELARADTELSKVQDGMGKGTVSAWREYRCALRNWPEHENFPAEEYRPIAPDEV